MNTDTLTRAKENVGKRGFLDIDLDPTLDLFAAIERLKKEKKRCIAGTLLPGTGHTGCSGLYRR